MSEQHPSGGGSATRDERERAGEVLAARAGQLTAVRGAAGKWQTGLAGLTGTIAIFGLVQGRDDVDALTGGWGAAYGICLAAALACSVGGGVLAMRAAFGLPKLVDTREWTAAARDDAEEARRSAGLLRAAVLLTVASLAFVAATLAVAWYAPRPETASALRVHRPSGSADCGTVVRASGGTLVLKTSGGERQVRLGEVDGMEPLDSCPGGG